MVPVHIEHFNVVMGSHDASDHRLHVSTHAAARAVNLDLLPRPLYRDALEEPTAPTIGALGAATAATLTVVQSPTSPKCSTGCVAGRAGG
jgi:hypothetical protein